MNFCPKCGIALDPQDTFCNNCGKALRPAAPAKDPEETTILTQPPVYNPEPVRPPVYNPAPVQQAVVPVVQTTPQAPRVSGGVKAKGFVGMGLSILGLVFAALGALCTLLGFVIQVEVADVAVGFVYAVYFGVFSFPLTIVGRILSGKSYDAGNRHASCTVGGKIGLAGLIVSCAMMMLGFISLLAIL